MSNHSGSYLLNHCLHLLHKEGVFTQLGQDRSRKLILEMIDTACRRWDCNGGEILDGLAEVFGICSCCRTLTDDLKDELCPTCRDDE